MSPNQEQAKPFPPDQEWILMMLHGGQPIMWHRLYCHALDILFEKSLVWWHNRDPRGDYYSMVMITKKGILEYEKAKGIKHENATEDSDGILV